MKDRIIELYRPNTITRDLITNEDEINKIKQPEKTNWDYVFADSAEDEVSGDQKVKYRMKDVDIPATYETEVNYYDPTTIQIETEIRGQKKWINDTAESRPDSIKVYLLANNEQVDKKVVTVKTNWTYRFSNIPVYDTLGEKIKYTVKEQAMVGYKTTYEAYNIINSRIDVNKDSGRDEEAVSLKTSRTARIGLFILGAAAITAGLLIDQLSIEE